MKPKKGIWKWIAIAAAAVAAGAGGKVVYDKVKESKTLSPGITVIDPATTTVVNAESETSNPN